MLPTIHSRPPSPSAPLLDLVVWPPPSILRDLSPTWSSCRPQCVATMDAHVPLPSKLQQVGERGVCVACPRSFLLLPGPLLFRPGSSTSVLLCCWVRRPRELIDWRESSSLWVVLAARSCAFPWSGAPSLPGPSSTHFPRKGVQFPAAGNTARLQNPGGLSCGFPTETGATPH